MLTISDLKKNASPVQWCSQRASIKVVKGQKFRLVIETFKFFFGLESITWGIRKNTVQMIPDPVH